MAYVYELSFDVPTDQYEQLRLGATLQRVLGYLRSLLPNFAGFMASRAMFSLHRGEITRVVFQSVWQDAEYLNRHLTSRVEEQKVLREFAPKVTVLNLTSDVYEEVE